MNEPTTPTTEEIRYWYILSQTTGSDGIEREEWFEPCAEEFDRWLRSIKAQTLREAAAISDPDFDVEVALGGSDYVVHWLNALADQADGKDADQVNGSPRLRPGVSRAVLDE